MRDRGPHAVPRGLLRFYILKLLTESPMKGYELIMKIENRTQGVWKPGPGSIYPMIASLRRDGLIESTQRREKEPPTRRGTMLQITDKGKDALIKFRQGFKSRMHSQSFSLFGIFAEVVSPGEGLEDVVLAARRGQFENLKRFLDDDYWKAISPEKKRKFLDTYTKILQDELQIVNKIH